MPASFLSAFLPEFPLPEPQPGLHEETFAHHPIPVVYENTEADKIPLRVYAAIHLRVPDSGIDWLDAMIRRSRGLDGRFARD